MTLWISIHLPEQNSGPGTTLTDIATTLLQYTPELALYDSGSLLLDVTASLSLFKGPRMLCQRIRHSLGAMNAPARTGMAPTAMGAWLMARQDQSMQRRILSMQSLVRQLDALPVSTMPAAHPYLHWLQAIGCTTLKDLARLPRTGLRQRTSAQLITCLDAAYGKTALHLNWHQAPETFQALRNLEFHSTQIHALSYAARGLLEQLCGWLHAHGQAATSMQFSLHHEKGRHACPPSYITLNLSEPSQDPENFLLLFKEHLQLVNLPAPIIAIELHRVQTQPQCTVSGDLFPDRTQQRHQENQLLDILYARLGPGSILQPRPVASHIPEHANRWLQVSSNPAQLHSRSGRSSSFPDTRIPFWMLEHPMQLDTCNDRPMYLGHALHLLEGPDRIESGWWMGGRHEQRDYFVAHDNQHCRYWIYRQRGSDCPSWFLHGFFA